MFKVFVVQVNLWATQCQKAKKTPDQRTNQAALKRREKGGKDCYEVLRHCRQVNGQALSKIASEESPDS